ncbi:MAG: maltose alpha-D-glucosyltransferase [Chloroflexaceae bacterium]|jgi:maltose alpha-D-glucosyltransferase/alpha-amylase|nr:maltose alpha-D-glucosyltransferase [Chloroflexaceae bacterium]
MTNPTNDPFWYKDAIIYELHVRAFHDSDGDGIGDFRGLTEKLDYLQDLGVTAIWILPFYPSPLRDDGYDIADYTSINPMYGTMRDVQVFVKEAHRRGLKVITELVCNHTSDQHPWFQRARRAPPGSPERNFYVWSDTYDKYRDTRIIFKDFETSNWAWDSVANAYFWHRFYRHQPDLNFDNPRVRAAIIKVMEFWLKLGVDGLRLDAIPYLYEREGTDCENLPETHGYLKALRRHVDTHFADRMLLAEANQWPEDSVAYFGQGKGDECHMSFHFPLMPRLFMSIHLEDRFPILDILAQTPPIPETSQWALFLRNHDELTLEMVTDEERDYMYRVYASDPQARINLGIRRRLAPLLQNNRRRIELMNGLLFSLPGTPVLYYGDEIGMGDNIYLGDRNGVRTPMQWTPDRNAGFSAANRQQLFLPVITDPEYHYEAINVATQQRNPSSLLWWMKRLIALRKRYKAFGRGSIEFLQPANRKVLAFTRSYEDERILVVANLSRFVQGVELDLSAFRGMVPVELFGRIEFPPVREAPYFITLGPHEFFWFALEPQRAEVSLSPGQTAPTALPELAVSGVWESVFAQGQRGPLAALLPGYLRARRWFGGKGRRIRSTTIQDVIPLPFNGGHAHLLFAQVEYLDGDPQTYLLPLAIADEGRAEQLQEEFPQAVMARLTRTGERKAEAGAASSVVLFDAMYDPAFCRALLEALAHKRSFGGERGTLAALPLRALRLTPTQVAAFEPRISRAEQSNSSAIFGDQFMLKLFRRLDEGTNPEVELGRFLTEQGTFTQTSPLLGLFEYRQGRKEPAALAVLQGFVKNEGDAWDYTLDSLRSYFEFMASGGGETGESTRNHLAAMPGTEGPQTTAGLLVLAAEDLPPVALETIGPYLQAAQRIGQRTAELHLALAQGDSPDFAPEPFNPFYQRSVYQSLRAQAQQAMALLRDALPRLPEAVRPQAERLASMEAALINRFNPLRTSKFEALRTRIHGDYHLGQVLFTGDDFVIIDFEGEPARSLRERRLKRSPLRDVAGMLRSFYYAAATALSGQVNAGGIPREEDRAVLEPAAVFWTQWVSVAFLREYLRVMGDSAVLPRNPAELAGLLEALLLDKAVYELIYELNNRPDWVAIPLRSVLGMVDG